MKEKVYKILIKYYSVDECHMLKKTYDEALAAGAAQQYKKLPEVKKDVRFFSQTDQLRKFEVEELEERSRYVAREMKKQFGIGEDDRFFRPPASDTLPEGAMAFDRVVHNKFNGKRGTLDNLDSWLFLAENEGRQNELNGMNSFNLDTAGPEQDRHGNMYRRLLDQVNMPGYASDIDPAQIRKAIKEKLLAKIADIDAFNDTVKKLEDEINQEENKYKPFPRQYLPTKIERLYLELFPEAPFFTGDKRTQREVSQRLALYKFNDVVESHNS